MLGIRAPSVEALSLEHRVEVDTLSGAARLYVPLRTSPGREGFGPTLALAYSSGERSSTFGAGWVLSGVPSIGLDTRRQLPSYRDDGDRYVYAGGEELVPFARDEGGAWRDDVVERDGFRVHRYRCRTERSYERFERWVHLASGRVHWLARARNGVVSVFGERDDGSSRIADPDAPERTFQWLLEAQYHPKGSAILFDYKPEDRAGVSAAQSFEARRLSSGTRFAQRYLKRVRYGNSRPLSHGAVEPDDNEWRFEVVLDYGEHGDDVVASYEETRPWLVRADPFSSHRAGFELRTWRLCRRVLMFHRFDELGDAPRLIGATELTHREDPTGSVLERIVYRGFRTERDTGAVEEQALPPLSLRYSEAEIEPAFSGAPDETAENAPVGVDGARYRWVDLEGEGLSGILSAYAGAWYFKENLGDGRFGPQRRVDELPAALSSAFRLSDFDSDGNLDLVGFEGREAGFFTRDREQGRWEGFRAFRALPRIDLRNARAAWVDLNGDGHADLVVDHGDRLTWYPSEGADGFAAAKEISRPGGSLGPPAVRADGELRTFFADMTGDGLLDVVQVESGRVEYWPNLGHGRFGPGVGGDLLMLKQVKMDTQQPFDIYVFIPPKHAHSPADDALYLPLEEGFAGLDLQLDEAKAAVTSLHRIGGNGIIVPSSYRGASIDRNSARKIAETALARIRSDSGDEYGDLDEGSDEGAWWTFSAENLTAQSKGMVPGVRYISIDKLSGQPVDDKEKSALLRLSRVDT